MNLEREKEFVSLFHYDARNLEYEKENGTPETQVNVQIHILETEEDSTKVQTDLSAMIVLEPYVLSSAISQVTTIQGQKIEEQGALSEDDMKELAAPLFDLLRRMTYELTEVATDEPGLKLEL